MELTLEQALQKGVEAHKAGKAQEADKYYTAILKGNPKHPHANHNMGVLAVGIGKLEAALPFFKTALEGNKTIAQFWLSYIDALVRLNRIDDAKAVLDQARDKGVRGDGFDQLEQQLAEIGKDVQVSGGAAKSEEPRTEQLQNLINLYTQGQYQIAQTQASQLLKQFPNSVNLYNIIGVTDKELGNLDEAIDAYNKALSIRPNIAEIYNNIGIILKDQGKLEEAIDAYNKALSIKPDYAEAYNNKGYALKDQVKLEESIDAFSKALSIKPDYAEAYNNMGITLKHQGKLEEAIDSYNKALSIKPDYAKAYNNKGTALRDQNKLQQAIGAFNKALSLKPCYAEAYNNLGTAFQDQGNFEEARSAYRKALSIKPDYAKAHLNLSYIKKYKEDDDQLVQVQKLYKREDLREDTRCSLSFALAKMYEDLGKLDKAFVHLAEGNNLRKKLINYSTHQDENLFRKLKIVQPNLLKNSLKIKKKSIKIAPIFILGMPRSGTTLVEQIISSHSEVTGAGELIYMSQFGGHLALDHKSINTAAISIFRDRYLSEVSKLSNGKRFITDKMPQNFGFIPLICAAFPEAKIIHIKRNAAATCWSNYKTYFTSDIIGYCYDLKDVVSYYGLYSDLMKHWQSKYGDRIYNLNYENLITDQKKQTRKLIKHLGLSWEAACLSPHKNKRSVRTASQQQVRQEIYKGSSEAWRKYEPYLNGALDDLPSL